VVEYYGTVNHFSSIFFLSQSCRLLCSSFLIQIHIRWHEREDRAEIEAAREKAEVIAARQKAEDEFLAATKQARAARVVEEKRWAAADKAVMAEEFAAALGANEVRRR